MRHPTTHSFLKWLATTAFVFVGACIGLVAALAEPYPRVGFWGQEQFDQWWPIVSAPLFLLSGLVVIAFYILAIIWTGKDRESANEKYDITLRQGWNYIVSGHIDRDFEQVCMDDMAYVNQMTDLWQSVRQHALDDDIQLWGRLNRVGLLLPIPAEYWKSGHLEYPFFVKKGQEVYSVNPRGGDVYHGLMVNKKQFERVWPWTARMKVRRDWFRLKNALRRS